MNCVFRFATIAVLCAFGSTGQAELRVSIKPDPITAQTTSALIIQASSLRLDVTVVRPDLTPAEVGADAVIDRILGQAPAYDLNQAKRTLPTTWSIGLFADEAGSPSFGTQRNGQPEALGTLSIFQVIEKITQESWRGRQGEGNPYGQVPDMVLVVELDLPTAILVEQAIDRASRDLIDAGSDLPIHTLHEQGIDWILTALDASRITESQISSEGAVIKQDLSPQSKTVLGVLYEVALDLTARPTQGADGNIMAGCRLTEAARVSSLSPRFTEEGEPKRIGRPMEILYQDFIALDRLESFFIRAAANRLDDTSTAGKWIAYAVGGFTQFDLTNWVEQKIAAGIVGVSTVPTDYLAAFFSGSFDPSTIDVYACAGTLRARGARMRSASILERSLAYRATTQELERRAAQNGSEHPSPKFFVAAESVTKMIGVGLADVLDDVEADRFTKVAGATTNIVLERACAGFSDNENIVISREARELLRTINWELYHNVNLPQIAYLMGEGQFNRPFTLKDPVTGKTLTRDLHPMFRSMRGTLLPFDLRMVLAEQGYIESRLPALLPQNAADRAAIQAELTLAQRAVYCLQLKEFLPSPEDEAHRAYLTKTREYLEAAIEAGLFEEGEKRFGNYWWRVATGSAMVMIAHDKSVEEFVDYLRLLMMKQREPRVPQTGTGILHSTVEERLVALFAAPPATLPPLAMRALETGVGMLASDSFEEDLFWECPGVSGPRQSSISTQLDAAQRLETVLTSGGMSAVLAFELGSGGAINVGAMPDGAHPPVCSALASRRDRLEGHLTAGLQFPDFSTWTDDGHLLIMERSVPLRTALAPLAPYLKAPLDAGSPLQGEALILARVSDAVSRRQDIERRITLLQILKSYDNELLGQLGLPGNKLKSLATAVEEDRPQAVEGVGVDEYRDHYTDEALAAFLKKHEQALLDLFVTFESAWIVQEGEDAPIVPVAPDRFVLNDFFLSPEVRLPGAGTGLNGDGVVGLVLGGVAGLQAGIVNEEAGIYTAKLMARRPAAVTANGAGATASCSVDVVAYEEGDLLVPAGCAQPDAGEVRDQVSSADLLPLGITFPRLRLTEGTTCNTANMHECRFALAEMENQAAVRPDSGALRETLLELGMPEFVSFTLDGTQEISPGDTLDRVVLKGDLEIIGIDFGPADLVLRDNGIWKPVIPELVRATEEALQNRLAEKLRQFEVFLKTLSVEWQPDPDEAPLIRFGPELSSDGTPSIVGALDWPQKSMGLRAIYALDVRLPSETPGQAALVRAGVDLRLGPDGWQTKNVIFEDDGLDAVSERLATLVASQIEGFTQDYAISVLPRASRGDLFFDISFETEIEGCPVRLSQELAISALSSDAFNNLFNDMEDQLKDAAIGCASKPIETAINQALDAQDIDILGVSFRAQTQGGALSSAIEGALPLTFSLLTPTGEGSPLGPCSELDGRDLDGIALKYDGGIKLDFRAMEQQDRRRLGEILGCRVAVLTPEAMKSYFELKKVEVGHNLIAVDIVLKNMPILGTIVLPRQNLSNLEEDFGEVLLTTLSSAANAQLAGLLVERLGETEISGLGSVQVGDSAEVKFDLFSEDPKFSAPITLNAYGITIEGTVEVAFARGLDAVRVSMNGDQAIEAVLENALSAVLDYLPSDSFKVEHPRIGRLDDQGNAWGLVFGFKADLPIGPGLEVGAKRVVLSEEEISLGEKITGGVATPISLGPVALSKTLISIYTGEDGTKSGIEIGADLTAFEASLAHLVKLRAILDLRDMDKPAFTAKGDLIVLNALEVFTAEGRLDLSKLRATLDAQTTDAISDVIDFSTSLDLDGDKERFLAESTLAVLGVDLEKSTLAFCVKACDDGTGRERTAELSVEKFLGFGRGTVHAVTDLDFRDPELGAGIQLDLFGWKPGGANFDADLQRVRVGLRFLGMRIRAITPSIETMTPGYIMSLLKALFDISLEDLLKIDLTDITISVMSGDGSVSEVHQGSSDEGDAAEAGEEGQETTRAPQENTGGSPPPVEAEDGGPPPGEEGGGAPPRRPWGQTVWANVCEKRIGTPGSKTLEDNNPETRIVIRSISQRSEAGAPFRFPVREPGQSWIYWRTYTQGSALALCPGPADPFFRLRSSVVGTDRWWQSWGGCSASGLSRYTFRNLGEIAQGDTGAEPVEGAVNLSTELACVDLGDYAYSIWGTWFLKPGGDGGTLTYQVAPRCPTGDVLGALLSTAPHLTSICGPEAGVLEVTLPTEGQTNGYAPPALLAADPLYKLQVTQLAPQVLGGRDARHHTLQSEELLSGLDIRSTDGASYRLEALREIDASGATLRWHMKLKRPGAEEAVTEVSVLKIPAQDPIMRFTGRPAIIAEILALWMEAGRRPATIETQDDRYIVLIGTDTSGNERLVWLWESPPEDRDVALQRRTIYLPRGVPMPGTTVILDPGPSPAKAALVRELWPEVQLLKQSTGGWDLTLGLNDRTLSQSWALSDRAAVGSPDQTIHLLLDEMPQGTLSVASIWDASLIRSDSATSISRDDRRRCTTRRAIATVLGENQMPALTAEDMMRRNAVDLALRNPERFNRQYRGQEALPEPFVRLLAPCPGSIQ